MFGAVIPFYQVSRGRWWRVRWSSFWAGLFAAVLYLLTVSRTAYPGASAQAIASVAGLDTPAVFSRPILHFFGRLVAALPLPGDLAFRFNLVAAILGGVLVGLLFQLVWFLVTEFMCEESARSVAPRTARLAAWTVALCTIFSLPVWMAGTRFTYDLVDVTLFVFCFYLMLLYAYRDEWIYLTLFAVCYGFGMCESYLFLLMAPLVFLCWARVEWINSDSGFRPCFWLNVMVGAVAFIFDFLLSTWQTAACRGVAFAGSMAVPTMVSILHEQYAQFVSTLPSEGWILVAATGYVLFAVVYFTAQRVLQNSRSHSSLILLTVTSFLGLYGLFYFKGTAWASLAPEGHIPLLGTIMTTVSIGLIVACWRALATMAAPVELKDASVDADADGSDAEAPVDHLVIAGKNMGSLFCPLMLFVAVVALGSSVTRFRLHDGDFADYIADCVLDGLAGRDWIVANDLFDANLELRAHARHQPVVLLQPYRTAEQNYRLSIRHELERQVPEEVWLRANALLEHSFLLFVEELILNMPDINKRAVCLSMPDMWYNGNYRPYVGSFFFGGRRMNEPAQPADSVIQIKQWDRYGELVGIQSRRKPCPLSKRHREAMTRQVSLQMNNFGNELDDKGRTEEAFKLYELARKYNPDNVSALLNLIDLVMNRQMHTGYRADLQRKLEEVLKDKTMHYPLWALSRYHGYIRNYKLFQAQGLAWVCSSSPSSVLDTLRQAQMRQATVSQDDAKLLSALASVYAVSGNYEASLVNYRKILTANPKDVRAVSGAAQLMLRQGMTREAYGFLKAGLDAGVAQTHLRPDWAVYYLATGELNKARLLLDDSDVLAKQPTLLGLLGLVMIEQKEVTQVEKVIIPKMTKELKGRDQYFTQILQGRVYQLKGKPYAERARACFLRAIAYRPDMDNLINIILSLDVTLDDAPAAELHAIQLLRRKADDPYANYILGTFRLGAMKFADSEHYLEKAAKAKEPLFEALNNYAEVLLHVGKYSEAEAIARQAVKAKPAASIAWSLLADACVRIGKLDEARMSIAQARELNAKDPRYAFIEARIALAEGKSEDAHHLLGQLATVKLSELEKRDLQILTGEIAQKNLTK